MEPADERTLLRRWQAGDLDALAELIARWQDPVARFAARIVGRDRAADVCQETFLRLMRSAEDYRERGRFAAWLFQVALNAARDDRRQRQRAERRDLAGLRSPPVEPPDLACERAELVRTVESAVAELPASQREVLALRHDAGLGFEEMSRLLGAPASTLKSRFAAALDRLRTRLAELGFHAVENRP